VNIEDLVEDNRVTAMRGEIALRLPSEAEYAIDARRDLGSVVSDFPGSDRRRSWLFGHRFVPEPTSAGHNLYLRSRYPDIIILKISEAADACSIDSEVDRDAGVEGPRGDIVPEAKTKLRGIRGISAVGCGRQHPANWPCPIAGCARG
jgi:hypothetical protein